MKPLVIFDSLYGNTHKVAETIAKSVSAKLINVNDVNFQDLKNVSRLIIGSPTHGGQATPAIQEFLKSIPQGSLKNVKFAAFDTRFLESKQNILLRILLKTIGYAAPKIDALLTEMGGIPVIKPTGFIVTAKDGPLADGELERAQKWLK